LELPKSQKKNTTRGKTEEGLAAFSIPDIPKSKKVEGGRGGEGERTKQRIKHGEEGSFTKDHRVKKREGGREKQALC